MQALTLTGAQPVKYQVKHACCATGQLGRFREGRAGDKGGRGGTTRGRRGKQKKKREACPVKYICYITFN